MGGLIEHDRIAQIVQKFNLFSNVFMKVVFQDPLACQHVLRILTGKSELVVVNVRTEYEIAQLMKYFQAADPNDMSQGDLSKRVHFLKCEEEGNAIMCKVTDELVEYGMELGEKRGEERGEKRGIELGIKRVVLRMTARGKKLSGILESRIILASSAIGLSKK